jgi:hypothetical protein
MNDLEGANWVPNRINHPTHDEMSRTFCPSLRQIVWKVCSAIAQRLGKSRIFEAAHDLHKAQDRQTRDFREVHATTRFFLRHAVMNQVMRQVGVVIGLTVILTFPVTVVSGAGSQKQSGPVVRLAETGGKTRAQGAAMTSAKTENKVAQHERRR